MTPNQPANKKSDLTLAIEKRARKLHEFDVRGFFGLANEEMPLVGIWVAIKAEENAALDAAHRRVEQCNENARKDPDLLGDAKLVEILHRVCKDPTRQAPDGRPYDLFPGPDWMHQHLTTDQVAALINLYHEVRKKEGPIMWTIDDELLESIAQQCHQHVGDDVPETVLGNAPREWLTQAFVLLSHKLHVERSERGKVARLDQAEQQRNSRQAELVAAACALADCDAANAEQLLDAVELVRKLGNELADLELAAAVAQPAAELAEVVASLGTADDADGGDSGNS